MGKQRINNIFKSGDNDILSIYVTTGYPELKSMPVLVEELAELGVGFIEVGMPYSDPLADGQTIQYSSSIALKNGIDLDKYFAQVHQVRSKVDIPLIFMGYFNQVLRLGVENFLQKCLNSGIDGLILPDLPPEIYKENYKAIFDKYDLSLSFLITPTTSDKRIKLFDELSSGFIYVISGSATTGKTNNFTNSQLEYFKRISRLKLNNPKVIGFGVSNREKYLIANKYSDGAIIGSAYIKALKNSKDYIKTTRQFVDKILKS